MIWTQDRWIEDQDFSIGAEDDLCVHGIGLFETFRTWNGRAPLLERHLDRLTRSASELGISFQRASLPDHRTIESFLTSNPHGGESVFRVTLSGGPLSGPGRVWMRRGPLPGTSSSRLGSKLLACPSPVSEFDVLSRHKTTNYWSRQLVHYRAMYEGFDEALFLMPTRFGSVAVEGSRTNLFLVVGDRLLTAAEDAPILPGVMRGLVLELAARIGLEIEVVGWSSIQEQAGSLPLEGADEVFLTNSVRGILPVWQVGGRSFSTVRTITERLQTALEAWLKEEVQCA